MSSEESDSDAMTLSDINRELSMPLIVLDVILGIYFVIGVIGNSVVAYIYSKKLKVKLDDKFFILVLAIMDIIVCLTAPPFCLFRNIFPVNTRMTSVSCKIAWFSTRTMNGISGLLILVIGIQRYLKVCRPFGKQMTGNWKIAALVATIIMIVIIHVPLFIFYGITPIPFGERYNNITGYRCGLLHGQEGNFDLAGKIFLYIVFASALCVMTLISLFYSITAKKIYKHVMRLEKMPYEGTSIETNSVNTGSVDGTGNESPSMSRHRSRLGSSIISKFRKQSQGNISVRSKKSPFAIHRYSIMFSIISLVCVITYVPALAANLAVDVDSIAFWTEASESERIIYLFLFQMYIVNHVVNPFIYACFDSKFRVKLKEMLCC